MPWKTRLASVVAVALCASTVAYAGYRTQTPVVIYDQINNRVMAYGNMRDARWGRNSEEIGCSVWWNGRQPSNTLMTCQAEDSSGREIFCYSFEPGLVDAAKNVEMGYVSFITHMSMCETLVARNASYDW